MELKVLFFGDIVGEGGRAAIAQQLLDWKQEHRPDLIIANAENATHGKGLQASHAKALRDLGIDVLTGGDHTWKYEDIYPVLEDEKSQVLRPDNYEDSPGRGVVDVVVLGRRVRIMNLLGRVFMNANVDNPFLRFDDLLAEGPTPDVVIVDFHAEATSEKAAFAHYVDGRAHLVFGTHTHVPTADARILPQGCGIISDAGMCGPTNSILGVLPSEPLRNFLTGRPWRYTLAEEDIEIGAVVATIDLANKRCTSIQHLRTIVSRNSLSL